MRKLILGLTAAAAIATPVAVAGSAQAATAGTGTLDTTTYADGHTYVHQFAADYTCSTVNGRSVVNFAIAGITPSGSGTGVLTPDSKGGGVFAFSGANGNYGYSYGGTYDA